MIDLSSLPEGTPVWVTATVVLILASLLVIRQLKELKGPFGTLSRWWENRALREIQKKKSLALEIDDLVDTRVNIQLETVQEQLKALRSQVKQIRDELESEREARRAERTALVAEHEAEVKFLEESYSSEVKSLKAQAASLWTYIAEAASYHRRLYLWAISQDYEPPAPHPFPDYYKWLDSQ